jgi:hypothetical protein
MLYVAAAGTQGEQDMVAAKPVETTDPSEVKTNVRHPLVAVTVPGDVVPVKEPINGDAVLGPL